MRKFYVVLILLVIAGTSSFAQKKAGTVYSEHEYIDAARGLWQAFADGDADKFVSFHADTVNSSSNGAEMNKRTKEQLAQQVNWWKENYSNMKVWDDKPAYPDALDYNDGGTWVQDWIVFYAEHNKTGIVVKLKIHNLYAFNDEGKVAAHLAYFDPGIFDEITKAEKTTANGKVYDNHPNIVTVRKAMRAFENKDLDTFASFFHEKASLASLTQELGESSNMEEFKGYITEKYYQDGLKFMVEEIGYPDCVYYARNDMHVVYSWWKITINKGEEKIQYGFMLSHDFDQDGKIVRQNAYVSSNHLDKF
jgi:hypothetical protein